MRLLSRIGSRLLALALALGGVAAVAMFFALPLWQEMERLEDDIATARALGERLSARIAHRDVYVEQVSDLEAALRESDRAIRANTDALAAAEIQRRLDAAAERHGIRLLSVQNLPSGEEDEGFVRVALNAQLAGSIEGLAGLLHELEESRPWLIVDRLHLQSGSPLGAPSDDADARPPISVSFELSGYMAAERGA